MCEYWWWDNIHVWAWIDSGLQFERLEFLNWIKSATVSDETDRNTNYTVIEKDSLSPGKTLSTYL